jgi:plastocyanin
MVTGALGAERPKAKTYDVDITGKGFQPARITIKVGDSVSWTNNDARDHTVTASNGAFASGNVKSGGSFSFRFTKPGNYTYSCSLHPRMKGTVVVQP